MEPRPLVLIVDDIPGNRMIIRKVLGEEGYRLLEAENGWEAVQIALKEIPDLILMDLMMPEMDGHTAIRRLRENEKTRRIPILVLSAVSEKSQRIQAFDEGALDFITKPFDRHELLAHTRSYTKMSLLNKKYVLSTLDPRTRLPNKTALQDDLLHALAPKLFVLKVDNLDAICKFYGNETASRVEVRFAELLPEFITQKLSVEPKVYYISDATFGIFLDDADGVVGERGMRRICELLLDLIRNQKFIAHNHEFNVDVTIGVSLGGGDILQRALLALDNAVTSHHGWFVAEEIIADLHKEIESNIFWLGRIRSAIKNDWLVPWFQPILNNRTGRVEKYEALMRLINPDGSVDTPGCFLSVAKKSRYYPDLTRIMLNKTFRAFADRGESVSVNLSVLDIENPDTRAFILDMIRGNPEMSRRLIVELVEEEGSKSFEAIRRFIGDVKLHGVRIALDDFGSGYSNFKRIMELNIDFLKLDGSLIRDILRDEPCAKVVRMMTEFAHNSGLLTIAEYVESQALQDELLRIGVDYSQGYLVGRPAPLE